MLLKALTFTVALAASVIAYPLEIDTPALVEQCVPVLATWEGGFPPYQFSIELIDLSMQNVISGGHLIGLFLNIDATQFLWPANVSAGTTIVWEIVDSRGEVAQTPSFVIQPGSADC
ncbi:hypothetical protein C8Q73DRAFT_794139 [Cubamyces lactineus]|nr:hypothetical protein C8Q73DRAFT_794139 [Cubamyces lactineus]